MAVGLSNPRINGPSDYRYITLTTTTTVFGFLFKRPTLPELHQVRSFGNWCCRFLQVGYPSCQQRILKCRMYVTSCKLAVRVKHRQSLTSIRIHLANAAPQLWNKLPHSLRVPYQSGSSLSSPLSSGSNPQPAVNLSHGMFHSQLKIYLFSKSFPP